MRYPNCILFFANDIPEILRGFKCVFCPLWENNAKNKLNL